jgi:hypothetical protein
VTSKVGSFLITESGRRPPAAEGVESSGTSQCAGRRPTAESKRQIRRGPESRRPELTRPGGCGHSRAGNFSHYRQPLEHESMDQPCASSRFVAKVIKCHRYAVSNVNTKETTNQIKASVSLGRL